MLFTSGMSALERDRVTISVMLAVSRLPDLASPPGLPLRAWRPSGAGHSALLGGLPQLKIGRPRRGLAMSAEDGVANARCVAFLFLWLGWHVPTPRAPARPLGFAIGGGRGHSESVVVVAFFRVLVGWLGVWLVGVAAAAESLRISAAWLLRLVS